MTIPDAIVAIVILIMSACFGVIVLTKPNPPDENQKERNLSERGRH